jgi:lipopolysaccharide transport system ATP-binding protein
MSDTVIRVENLSKKYIIRHQQAQQYTALRDVIADGVKSIGRRLFGAKQDPLMGSTQEEFWALKDVSFEVKQGDRIGIIGRNGAGKSTLLKILSRITEPTKGEITLNGRVASLLEVGTGFHPELTGRENIFLNGAILGMSKIEIRQKFDEIIAFAEVEQFLDTPVKRYSSGMYVRLAFSVAAHLEPEILVVDEVLAVGDTKFQRKCLGKMESAGKEGRTILFVSHQMAAIERLCENILLLEKGQIKYQGKTREGINKYLTNLEDSCQSINISKIKRSGTGQVILSKFSIENKRGEPLQSVRCGDDITLIFYYQLNNCQSVKNVSLGFSIHNITGETISILYNDYSGDLIELNEAAGKIKCTLKDFPFSVGRYFVGARILVNGIEADWPRNFVGSIDVEAGDFYGDGQLGHSGTGPVLLRGIWEKAESFNVVTP